MSLLFFDGFESGSPKPEYTSGPGLTTGSRTGNGGMDGSSGCVLGITASAKVICGFAHTNSTLPGPTSQYFVQFRGDAGVTTHLTVGYDASGFVTLRLGGATGTLLATSAYAWPPSQWRYMEVSATIADAGGTCVVKVDGATIINFTGDTKNAGTATTIDRLAFLGSTAAGGANTRWDDLYVLNGVDATATQGRANNDFLGDIKVEPLFPNADGTTNQFVGSDGNSVSNYLLVDETSTSTADYVGSPTPGDRDLYNITDLAANIGTVYAIRTNAYVSKSDAGLAGIKTILRESSGTLTDDAVTALSTTWAYIFGGIRATRPGTTSPWTPADINALQIGVEATAS